MKALLALATLPLLALSLGCSGSNGSDPTTAGSSEEAVGGANVSGNWVNSTPCNTTFFDQNTGHLKCDGFTDWTGTFTGSSHYFFDGFVDLTTGDISGGLSETFTGRGLHTSGTFHMTETMTISASTGAILIHSRIDRGTQGFCSLRGTLTFSGTSDTSGIGTGTYSGNAGIPQNDNCQH